MTNVSLALPLADEKLATALTEELQHVEEHLRSATSHADTVVNEASQHLANAGGKRLRPLLTLLAAHVGQGVNDDVRQAALVVELTHLASLYHDDVMDSAPLRRGAPSAHEVWETLLRSSPVISFSRGHRVSWLTLALKQSTFKL